MPPTVKLLVASFFVVFGVYELMRSLRLFFGVKTTGVVQVIERDVSGEESSYIVHYKFLDMAGVERNGSFSKIFRGRVGIGQEIAIRFDPERPYDSMPDRRLLSLIRPIGVFFAAILFAYL